VKSKICTICDCTLRVSRTCLLEFCKDGKVKSYPGGIQRALSDAPHTRRHQSPTTCENALKQKLNTKATPIENVPILEVVVNVWSEKGMRSQLNGLQVGESQNWLSRPSCTVRKNDLCAPVQSSGSLCVSHRTPLPTGMMSITSRLIIAGGPRRPCR
jgi:hypothetical protein